MARARKPRSPSRRSKTTVGVIGCGFVGNAVSEGFRAITDVKVFDIDPERATHTFAEVARQDVVIVCVPTPTKIETGVCDLTILDSVIEKLAAIKAHEQVCPIVAIKSTIPPMVVSRYQREYPEIAFVSNPEFLTERTAVTDFADPKSVVIGADPEWQDAGGVVENLYRCIKSSVVVLRCSNDEAALIKYARNCFFAVKIAYFNEIYAVCEELGCCYDAVREGVLASTWVNRMHTQVPGPDGRFGFGGKCFPKDMMAMETFSSKLHTSALMIAAALNVNDNVRDDQDWMQIPGAAT